MTAREKLKFLQYDFIQKLRELDANTTPLFGKMNLHQMIEHFTYAVQVAAGKIAVPAINEGEVAEKSYRWMMDLETSFKDNTPNQLLPDEPQPVTTPSIGDAIDNLEDEIQDFLDIYKGEPGKKVQNAFFGELDYYEQVQLLYKHAKHHARQFSA
jgi:hypothetical protein